MAVPLLPSASQRQTRRRCVGGEEVQTPLRRKRTAQRVLARWKVGGEAVVQPTVEEEEEEVEEVVVVAVVVVE